ncbi:hypothetical protein AAFF_G00282630 [Aldrovandia affinis]|uniref:Uncharacterized protein n=1 Tax=Aldrovandia affinis TaxID=143900 RepID=A0AAD7TBE4_9TELE|nr:hypothetical protein AAFF_G00282630 [Aldrovandia affinis]
MTSRPSFNTPSAAQLYSAATHVCAVLRALLHAALLRVAPQIANERCYLPPPRPGAGAPHPPLVWTRMPSSVPSKGLVLFHPSDD